MAAEYPYLSHHFKVTFLGVGGITGKSAQFKSVSGLDVSYVPASLAEGGEPRFKHQLTDRPTWGPLTLERGLIDDFELWAWCTATFTTMHTIPTNLIVSLLGDDHQPVMSWFVVHAIPMKWSTDGFDATSTKVMIESFQLSYQYFIRI
jgi:phage tail-like protein